MRRNFGPFYSRRFVLNIATGEIHDLDNEKPQCQIDEIKLENVRSCDTFENAELTAAFNGISKPNGCHYCNASKDSK